MLLSNRIETLSVTPQPDLASATSFDGLFYCASPLQILSAFEAREHFNLKDCLLILNSSLSVEHDAHNNYLCLAAELKWDHVILLDRSQRSRFLEQLRALKAIQHLSFSKVFIGEWSSFGRMIYGICEFKAGFLLDDGVATYRQQREIVYPSIYLPWRKRIRDFLRDARFLPFGYWKKRRPIISFFSAMVRNPLGQEYLVRHDFRNLREVYARMADGTDTSTLFIGTHLESHPEFTLEKLRAIHAFAEERFHETLPFDFYLHRNESAERVRAYAPAGFYRLHSYQEPIEVLILRLGIQPRIILSSVSSALITLKALCPESRVIALDVRGFLSCPDQSGWVYDLFASHDIEVIEVPVSGQT